MERPFALVRFRWRQLAAPVSYPSASAIGATGYREADGVDGLFSVYVVFLSGEAGADNEQDARVFALAEQMEARLPAVGERFVLTAGATPVAEGVTMARGLWTR